MDSDLDFWSRRKFLGTGGVAAAGAGLVLAGCGGGSRGSAASSPANVAAEKPRRGGTLTFGTVVDSLGSDTVDGQAAFGVSDWARSYALYSGLARIDAAGEVKLWMAESIEPNSDATQWQIKIPSGITTHKGKSFTAKDVLFSLKRMIKKQTFGSNTIAPDRIDLAGSKVINPTTLLVKYKQPFSQFVEGLSVVWNVMVPEGFDPKHPDGTGPFRFKAFNAGQSASFTRFENYFENGKPYLDELIVTAIQDETAQVNALQSGQADLINFLSAASIDSLKAGGQKTYVASKTGNAFLFTMRMDQAPFDDPLVRQAFRLMVDRPGMARQVFGEYGTPGNDIFNQLDPYYGPGVSQRAHDPEQAKALLAKAGKSGLSVTLTASPDAAPGAIQASQALIAQAKAAGVNVKINQQTGTQYFAKSYLKVPFGVDFFQTIPYIVESGMAIGPRAPFNPTHQDNPAWNKLWNASLATLDKAKQKELAQQMQQIDYDSGGNIIPMFFPGLDASSQKVQGIQPSTAGTGPNAFYWPDVWLKS